jgi:hypothetical protein
MGSYATLKFGHFTLGEWKSHVPLEPLVLFKQEDYKEGSRSEGEESVTHELIVPACTAKLRADARGLTVGACQRLFAEFRADGFWHFGAKSGREWWTPNDVTFKQFLSACKRVFKMCDNWYAPEQIRKMGKKAKRIFSEEFFSDATEYYFDDAWFCILMRAFLEVVPGKCEIVLDISDLVWGEYLDLEEARHVHDRFTETILQRIGIDYQLYGFVMEEDPNVDRRLRHRISRLSEDQFVDHVLLPLLDKMGFQRLRRVKFHGRNEFGSDILPFRYTTPLGTVEYYALQAKVTRIHGKSAEQGNAGELISQATQAFHVAFVDDIDNERKRIDKFIIATSKAITPDARHAIESAMEGRRQIVFLDVDRIVSLVKQHHLVQYLLFTTLGED